MLEKRICPHFHISLQSGSDNILKLMNRNDYTASNFLEISQKINKRLGMRSPFLTADVIVGFPGEGEAEFAQTLKTLNDSSLNKLHVFVFSPRPGTKAFDIKQTEQGALIKERRDALLNFSDTRYKASITGMLGKTVQVLWETDTFGHSENYYPVKGDGKANTVGSIIIGRDSI
ncbi:MAG: radical SAM protein, partial [Pseudomonadota bacterium]